VQELLRPIPVSPRNVVRREGAKVQDTTLGSMFVRCGQRYSNLTAVRSHNGDRTYGEVLDRAAKLANVLRGRGLVPGDRVLMVLENCSEAVEAIAGIALAGLVVVPVNAGFKASEVDHVLRDSGARALIHTDGVRPAVAGSPTASTIEVVLHIGASESPTGNSLDYESALADADPTLVVHEAARDDLAIIGYTSGTTGFPKGAMVDQATLVLCIRSSVGVLRVPHYSRLAFIGGLGYAAPWWTIILPHLYVGGMVNLIRDYTVDSWFEIMREDRTTFTYCPSPLIDRFVERAKDYPDVIERLETLNHSASAATPAEIQKIVGLVGDKYFHGWGATEIVGALTCLTRNDAIGLGEAEDRWATVGRPGPTTRLFVLDDDGNPLPPGREHVGEFAVEQDTIFSGYWNNAEQTAAAFKDGRYLTGDVGWIDHAGYAYIVDRKRDMIVSGGANVYPAEVERVLRNLEGVAEIAVFGIPDDKWGETVAAAVVRAPGAALSEEDVVAFAREHMASFKKPTSVRFLDELPRNPMQKVRKDALRKMWSAT
jgi:fatty-acyl-CoA synthase